MLNKGQKVRITIGNSYFNLGQIVEVHNPDKYGAWLIGEDRDGNYTHWYFQYSDFELVDSVVESIIEKFKQRSAVGIKKYNTTLDRTDLSFKQWVIEFQHEMMDGILYIEKIIKELDK
jgi:hypothetical protein